MAAALAEGTTVLENAAREPEVVDLTQCLIAMGADIEGVGTTTFTIKGVERLNPCSYNVIPDRIETGTYLVAAAATPRPVKPKDTREEKHPGGLLNFQETRGQLRTGSDWIELAKHGNRPRA